MDADDRLIHANLMKTMAETMKIGAEASKVAAETSKIMKEQRHYFAIAMGTLFVGFIAALATLIVSVVKLMP